MADYIDRLGNNGWYGMCLKHKDVFYTDDFCSYGERKDGDHEQTD